MTKRFLGLFPLLLAPSLAFSQSLEPRLYLPLPTGRNVINLSYSHTSGDLVLDTSLPLTNSHAQLDAGTLAYVRTFGLLGRSAQVQAITTFATGEASATVAGQDTTRNLDGPTDPMVRLAVNLVGGPARRLSDLKGVTFGTMVGASLTVTMPLGSYDTGRRINLGANRWSVKPELGIIQPVGTEWAFEGYFGAWLFGDNDEYLEKSTVSQDPLWTWQAHAIRIFGRKGWLALDGTWFRGGTTSIDGVDQNTFEENARLGATAAWFVSLKHAIKASFATGVTTRYGGDFDTFSIGYQYGWGS
ncbi:MAG TPA: transporter [Candidatus Krumholzibacteria bacterium]